MKSISLSGLPREGVGKTDAKTMRKEGRVPGVLYGGEKQIHFSVAEVDLKKIVWSPDVYRIEFECGGTTTSAIIKDIQFHPVTDNVLHIDLLELFDGRPVVMNMPVRPEGTAEGVRNGGRLAVNFRRLALKALPKDMPEAVSLDVTPLKIGDDIRISQVDLPGVTVVGPENAVVVSVKRTRAAMSADTDEEGEEGEEGGEEGAAEGGDAPAE